MDLVSYLAGSGASDFKRSKIENILAMKVKEPAQTEWDSQVVFAPNKDGA